MIKRALLVAILYLSTIHAQPHKTPEVYKVCNFIGDMTDWFVTRGGLEQKYEAMFEEVALKMGVADRRIKVRNVGLLGRLVFGYYNAMAHPLANRVYMNQDLLNELPDEHVRFIMAHELSHHRNHDLFKRVATAVAVALAQAAIIASVEKKEMPTFLKAYLTTGLYSVSLWKLITAQVHQHQETRADAEAITIAGSNPTDAAEALKIFYYPDAENWPIYGKIQAAIAPLVNAIYSLPILKQHAAHLASYTDRVNNLKGLTPAVAA